MAAFKIDRYEVHSVAHNTPLYPGIYGFISLYALEKRIATLWFHRDSVTNIPANKATAGAPASYYAHFGQAQLHDCVDLLRNEKPVFFNWNDVNTGAWLTTGQEPTGEEELP